MSNAFGIRELAIKKALLDSYGDSCGAMDQLSKPLPKHTAWSIGRRYLRTYYPRYAIGEGACGDMKAEVPRSWLPTPREAAGKVRYGYYFYQPSDPYCGEKICGFVRVINRGKVVGLEGAVTGDVSYLGVRRGNRMQALLFGSGAGGMQELSFSGTDFTRVPDDWARDDPGSKWLRVSKARFDQRAGGFGWTLHP